jgi:hypothetical protein
VSALKPSNPKDIIGSRKLDLSIVPDTLLISAASAFLEGALKYGRFNWRIAGVRSSIYYAALQRHMAKWWNGQDKDKDTRVHHLASAIACLTIILDAELYGKLTDDRPPSPNPDAMAELIDSQEGLVAHLKELFSGHDPYQYTIADTVQARTHGASLQKRRLSPVHKRSRKAGQAKAAKIKREVPRGDAVRKRKG